MANIVRIIAIGGAIGLVGAGGLAALSAASADEPQAVLTSTASDLFPAPFDPKSLVKYDIVLDPSVSTKTVHSTLVHKIGYGHKTLVSIVTTPSGTYSSDALTSPNVRYPGVEVKPSAEFAADLPFALSMFTTPFGTGQSTSFTSGSFTYYTYSFKPAH